MIIYSRCCDSLFWGILDFLCVKVVNNIDFHYFCAKIKEIKQFTYNNYEKEILAIDFCVVSNL